MAIPSAYEPAPFYNRTQEQQVLQEAVASRAGSADNGGPSKPLPQFALLGGRRLSGILVSFCRSLPQFDCSRVGRAPLGAGNPTQPASVHLPPNVRAGLSPISVEIFRSGNLALRFAADGESPSSWTLAAIAFYEGFFEAYEKPDSMMLRSGELREVARGVRAGLFAVGELENLERTNRCEGSHRR